LFLRNLKKIPVGAFFLFSSFASLFCLFLYQFINAQVLIDWLSPSARVFLQSFVNSSSY